jgi:arylsulfatase
MVWLAKAWLGLVLLAGALACGAESATAPSGDVLLITVDTLRPDHMGIYGYERGTTPNLDRWFASGLVYERAYSTEANTPPSVVSFLSGQLPQDHGVRLFYQLLPERTRLVPELLPERYQSAGFVSNMVLTDEALGIAPRFDHFDDHVDQREPYRKVYERNAERTTDAAILWLENERDRKRPLFLWVHYIDPHGPYLAPPEWRSRFEHPEPHPIDPSRVPRYQREPDVLDGLTYVDRYDAEIAYVDAEIDRLLRAYAATHPIDEALLIFTADHGESMMEHERWFTHGYHVYDEIVRVPLLLSGPGVDAGRTQRLSSGIDVFRTILVFAGAPTDAGKDAFDLRRPASIPAGRTLFTEATSAERQWRAAIRGDEKWMLELRGPGRSVLERRYYDLGTDAAELRPGSWADEEGPAGALLELARTDPDPAGVPLAARAGMRLAAPKVAPGVSAEDLERLKALGYAE